MAHNYELLSVNSPKAPCSCMVYTGHGLVWGIAATWLSHALLRLLRAPLQSPLREPNGGPMQGGPHN